jgi:signal transduction histidine kinase
MKLNSEAPSRPAGVTPQPTPDSDLTRMLRMGRLRLLGALLALAIVPMVALIGYGHSSAQSALRGSATNRLQVVITSRQRQIEAWVDSLSSTLYRTLVALPTLPDVIHAGEITALTPALRTSFDAATRPETGFTEVILVSADDRLLYSSNFDRYTAPRRLCLPRIVCASEFLTENAQTRLIVQYPILNSAGDQVGALLGLAPMAPLDGILGAPLGLGGAGAAYLVGPNGDLRWVPGQGGITPPEKARAISNLSLPPSVQVTENPAYSGLNGTAVTGVSAFIPRLFAWLVVEQSLSEIDQPVASWPLVTVAAALLITALALIVSRWLLNPFGAYSRAQQATIRDLRLAVSRAAESEQRRSRAMADMGHELRTPINSILNFSGFLNDGLFGTLNTDQTEMLRQIHSSSQHLLDLINDLVDMSQIEAGQMRLFVQSYDPAPVFDQVIGTLHSLILDKPITIYTDLPRTWPTMTGDRRRVLQILLNLASNAAKFTETGSITVRAHTFPNRLEVRVEDTGPGIAPEAAEYLFEPFKGGHNARGQEKGGTGLGLPLSRIFARMHGGDLVYTPGEDGGAVFTLSVPINTLGTEAPSTLPTSAAPQKG